LFVRLFLFVLDGPIRQLLLNFTPLQLSKTNAFMHTPCATTSASKSAKLPTALETATYAVTLLEDNPLFNSGHGAVFTRDGINELEASVMVTRGFKKRGVGATGLRRVRNPILLARAFLEHGEEDLGGKSYTKLDEFRGTRSQKPIGRYDGPDHIDAPSAQGHTLIHGKTAEVLATKYGLQMVKPTYYFTEKRWNEHLQGLERERNGKGSGTWSVDEYLPQGTCGAVALDEDGVICCATSTGGMTNKLTGRIGDTPVVGAGFWAEEWNEDGDPTASSPKPRSYWERLQEAIRKPGIAITLSDDLRGLFADCLPTPLLYTPISQLPNSLTTTRSMAASGTGNGDSFMRTAAVRSVAAIARWKPAATSQALLQISGPGGELQRSAGDRWGRTGEGEGGMIGIECAIVRDGQGNIVSTRSEIIQDYNCGGMFRAWINDDDMAVAAVWREGEAATEGWASQWEGKPEDPSAWVEGKCHT
jgi:L-asparaginase